MTKYCEFSDAHHKSFLDTCLLLNIIHISLKTRLLTRVSKYKLCDLTSMVLKFKVSCQDLAYKMQCKNY